MLCTLVLVALLALSRPCGDTDQHSPRRLRTSGVATRWFKTRVPYSANSTASVQRGRLSYRSALSLAGDIELNPGPQQTATLECNPGRLTAYYANVRSLKKQLGDLRSHAPVLEAHDLLCFTETWLNETVLDSEIEWGFESHTWYRRDHTGLGGSVACAVRSSLLPVRLPDPADTETILIRLRRLALTVAVCYRPPDVDASLQKITASLSSFQQKTDRLLVFGDFNLPEIS